MRSHFSLVILAIYLLNWSGAICQKASFNGLAAGWFTASGTDGFSFQAGLRYVPQFTFDLPVGKKARIDGELSVDAFSSYTWQGDTSRTGAATLKLYRFWLRYSVGRFEIRAGLQKINFGSASMLRPLMWFDRVDPRDPLKMTPGVASLLGQYYFKNNANIWLWSLIGNSSTIGWETVPSDKYRPEFGGRIQVPFPRGEAAFSYHNREGRFPDGSAGQLSGIPTFTENRIAIDSKVDLGVGLWIEGTISHHPHPSIPDYEKAFTFGLDYNFKIGQGMNVTAENMFINTSETLASTNNTLTLTGVSVSLPVSVITRVSGIIFYDWKNKGLYNFVNLSLTFNRIALNLIAYKNPSSFAVFNYDSSANLFAGAGGQVMVVYNY